MDIPKIIIIYDGIWEGNAYKGSILEIVFVPSNLTYDSLVVLVHRIVRADPNCFVYDLKSLLNTHDKIVRFKIESDRGLRYVLKVGNEDS